MGAKPRACQRKSSVAAELPNEALRLRGINPGGSVEVPPFIGSTFSDERGRSVVVRRLPRFGCIPWRLLESHQCTTRF